LDREPGAYPGIGAGAGGPSWNCPERENDMIAYRMPLATQPRLPRIRVLHAVAFAAVLLAMAVSG
jgi:uncharacterized membrane protein